MLVRTAALDVCLQKRLPSAEQWRENVKEAKARHGAAGVPSEERRVSPIVELSLLLVGTLYASPSIIHCFSHKFENPSSCAHSSSSMQR